MNVLVTGGAGYIGSVVVEELLASGHAVVALDNLSKGHRAAVAPAADFVRADLHDRPYLREVLERAEIDAVVHMAADSLVGESVKDPGKYYGTNVIAGLGLLDAMVDAGVQRLVFSSTAAVYGEPESQPIDESAPTRPTNPYGETKLAFERALAWYESAHGLRHACLRYFNAAGASERCGEDHDPETHLIPLVLQAAIGRIAHVTVFGEDYPTPDGTCIRDYVHVRDLARAHVLALGALNRSSCVYNLGCGGAGYSVREVIEAATRVTGRAIPVQVGSRRPGDPAVLVASSARIRRELDWRPAHGELGEILESAWSWMRDHPGGYPPNTEWSQFSVRPGRIGQAFVHSHSPAPTLRWPLARTPGKKRTESRNMAIQHVYALFDDMDHAVAALDEVQAAGCETDSCSAILHEGKIDTDRLSSGERAHNEGAAGGAVVVGAVGAVVVGLAALGGGLIGLGPLAAAAAAGGVTAAYGMLAGGLSGGDDPESLLRSLEEQVEKGKILIALETEDPEFRALAEKVFEKHGGSQVVG